MSFHSLRFINAASYIEDKIDSFFYSTYIILLLKDMRRANIIREQ